MSNHRLVTRVCPGCDKKHTYDIRNECHNQECAYRLRRKRAKGAKEGETLRGVDGEVLALLKKKSGPRSVEDIADRLDRGPASIIEAIGRLRESGYNVTRSVTRRGAVQLEAIAPKAASLPSVTHSTKDYEGRWFRFGVTGDKHLCNMHSRLDVMKLLYDLYASEGITTVYDTGNWIDGEAKFNKGELLIHGMDAQLDYWAEHHPQRPGITTHYVAGDDHEGWYQQRECLEIGAYAQYRAEKAGRTDLKYMGYMEALVKLEAKRGHRMMMVNHPGGGASYAISYKGQKYVESLQGGEKPSIVLQGHYHKFNLSYPREVWVLDTGTCCDQTIFMRKRQLQAHVGGLIVELMQAPDGRITRLRAEFLPFYDRNFYEAQRRRFGLPSSFKQRAA